MARTMNMPVQAYKDAQEKVSKPSTSGDIYTPLPKEPGKKTDNQLFVGLMEPGRWEMFSPNAEMIQKYNMNPDFKFLAHGQPLISWFMTLPLHALKEYRRSDGSTGFTYVLCPTAMNRALKDLHGLPPLFLEDRCAFCEAEKNCWSEFNQIRDSLGYDQDSFKGNTKGWNQFLDQNPALKALRDKANRDLKAKERHILSVFDLDKLWGNRPLDEGQDSVSYQVWFAPNTVWDSMYNIWVQHAEYETPSFYDILEGEGVLPLIVNKNTEKCNAQSMVNTNYSVMSAPGRKSVDPAWVDYLDNPLSMVDPTNKITILTYAEASAALDEQGNSYNKAPVSAPTAAAPVQPPQAVPEVPPVATPPVHAPPVATPPVHAPPAATPPAVAPQAPVAPPEAPQAPSVSQPPTAPIPPVAPPVAPSTATNPVPPMDGTQSNSPEPKFIPGSNKW
jgi:hypothetical protein